MRLYCFLRRYLCAQSENRTFRIMSVIERAEIDRLRDLAIRQDRIIAGLKVDLAIVIKDRDQLLAMRYAALAVGKQITQNERRQVIH